MLPCPQEASAKTRGQAIRKCCGFAGNTVDSDAHIDSLVGEHGNAQALLEQEGFPEELVVNANPQKWK